MRKSLGLLTATIALLLNYGALSQAQTTYHLHYEHSTINTSFYQLKTAGPDRGWVSIQQPTGILNSPGIYTVAQWETQTGVPGTSGLIPAGSTVTVKFYAYQNTNCSINSCPPLTPVYPQFRVTKSSGPELCEAQGPSPLPTTLPLPLITISCTTGFATTMTSTDRFVLWIGVNSTGYYGQMAGVDVEGTLGGQYDSTVIIPKIVKVPALTSVSPTSGAVGTSVQINGSNLSSDQGSTVAYFNGVPGTITQWHGDKWIMATVPPAATTGNVTVSNVAGTSNGIPFTVTTSISSLSPPAGAVGGSVTISGTGFGASQGTSQVTFNGVAATATSWGDASITATVPANATTGPVVVTVGGSVSNGVQFTVEGPPAIGSLSPASGAIGTSITINGSGFGATQSNSTVSFYGASATPTSWTDTAITVPVPAGTSTGPVTVTVAALSAQSSPFVLTSTAQLTDSLNNVSSYTSQILGGSWYMFQSTGSGCDSCTVRGPITDQYDASGNVLSSTDALGHTTSYTYDSNGNVLTVSAQLDANTTVTTSYTYNSFGEVLTVTDPLNKVTTNTYDSNGNLLTTTSPTNDVTQFAYDLKGELTQITDPLNRVTTLTYTPAGMIASVTDPQQNVTSYEYDSRGNRTAIVDAQQHRTTFAYDAGNRLTGITYPDNSTVSFTYDARNRRITATDQNSKTTHYGYDDADRLTSVTDPATHLTQYAYDTENNLLSITDAANHITSFAYDPFGRVTQTTFPSTLLESYVYDAIGNLTSKTDRKGQAISYVYDALNRLTHKGYPDSTGVDYAYDLASRLLQATDPTGSYGFTYDDSGRLTGTTTQYSFLPGKTITNSYGYDADSNRTSATLDGVANTFAYDTLNRLSTLTSPWAGSFTFGYDTLSRRTSLSRPNGINTNYSYDSLSHLLSVLHQVGATTLDGAGYTYDSAGNRTSKTNDLTGSTDQYTYDALYQLTQVTNGGSTTENYTYDNVGNRLSSLGVSTYSYNSSNQLTSSSVASFTYDSNGNTLTKADTGGTTSYAWDFENRLASVTLPGSQGTVTFKYDPFGRRIEKSSPAGTTIYAYDGAGISGEYDAAGNPVAQYAQGPGIDEPLAMSRAGAVSYYDADGLGSITSQTDQSGALVATYTRDSFGKTLSSSGNTGNSFGFTGRELDSETGVYYFRARYYDFATGRFLAEDPRGSVNGPNWYRYSMNRPTQFVDPSGTEAGYQYHMTPSGLVMYSPYDSEFSDIPPSYYTFGGSIGYWSPNIIYVPSSNSLYVTPVGAGSPGYSIYATAGFISNQSVNPDQYVYGLGGSACYFQGGGGCLTLAPVNGTLQPSVEVGVGLGLKCRRIPVSGATGGYTNTLNEIAHAVAGWIGSAANGPTSANWGIYK